MRRFTFRHQLGDRIAESELIECDLTEWQVSPVSREPHWSVALLDGRVRALRLPAFVGDTTGEPRGIPGVKKIGFFD